MSSVNAPTVKSITTNLKTIIAALKYNFEDGKIDPQAVIKAIVVLEQERATPERNSGEGPMFIEQAYTLTVKRTVTDKNDYREKAAEITFDFEENITVDSLNVGDLEDSKLVTTRDMAIDVDPYDNKQLMVVVALTVRFRDLRS